MKLPDDPPSSSKQCHREKGTACTGMIKIPWEKRGDLYG